MLPAGEREAAQAMHLVEIEARPDATTAHVQAKDSELSAARVGVALKLLGAIRGGESPSEEELLAARGLTRDELARAEHLRGEGNELDAPRQKTFAAQMVYLLDQFPGMTIGEAEATRSDEQRDTYERLDGSDL